MFGGDLQKLFPIAEERWSDSAKLDAMRSCSCSAAARCRTPLAMLVPPAWTDPTLDLDDDVRAFHEYHASLVEPWDGPAAAARLATACRWSRRSTATGCGRAGSCAPATAWS